MNPLYRAQAEIRAVLAQSPELEHARHAEDTLSWVVRLKSGVDAALALAALAHDIESADHATRVLADNFESYDAYKESHAQTSARILRAILVRCEVRADVVTRACRLVEMHEFGGDADANVLRDADSLSYFNVNLPVYLERKGKVETLRRSRWDYARLSERGRDHLTAIRHKDPRLNRIMRDVALHHCA